MPPAQALFNPTIRYRYWLRLGTSGILTGLQALKIRIVTVFLSRQPTTAISSRLKKGIQPLTTIITEYQYKPVLPKLEIITT